MNGNKVKCTCGWSWNKSDSSKKDMYICHNCGRDNSNNMKNGGWLDKYNEGGELNYNDYSVSAPEGYEGDEYSNVGRNYSSAWEGQFEDGGEIAQNDKIVIAKDKLGREYIKNQDSTFTLKGSNQKYDYDSKERKFFKINNIHKDGLLKAEDVYNAIDVADGNSYSAMGAINTLKDALNKKKNPKNAPHHDELLRNYLGVNDRNNLYQPNANVNTNEFSTKSVLRLKDDSKLLDNIEKHFKKFPEKDNYQVEQDFGDPNSLEDLNPSDDSLLGLYIDSPEHAFGNYKIRKGKDKKGEYVSYYDKWDLNPSKYLPEASIIAGKPFEIYNKKYINKKENGGEIAQKGKQVPFDQWYKTIPKTKNDTTTYNLRRAYELAPQKDLDAFVKNPKAHLMSAYENPETGVYEFMKAKGHPTLNKELDWYNSKDGSDFRNNYTLDTSSNYYKYIPKQFQMGGSMPGAAGFMYARTGDVSSNKKKAYAENGYVIKDDMGQYNHPGEITEIGSNQITMQDVPYPVLGVSKETKEHKVMLPEQDYTFSNTKNVIEYPLLRKPYYKNGGVMEGIHNGNISKEEIKILKKLGYKVDIL